MYGVSADARGNPRRFVRVGRCDVSHSSSWNAGSPRASACRRLRPQKSGGSRSAQCLVAGACHPASRQGIRRALDELGVATAQSLLEKCLGLSLSDQYWIRPAGSALRWSEVNFFEHPFSDDVGNILFGRGSSGDPVSLMSPDNTSDGWLKKKWTIVAASAVF